MTSFLLIILVLKFFIPGFFSVLFRAFGLGYKSKKSLLIGLLAYTVYTVGLSVALILLMGYGQFTHISPIVMSLGSMAVLIFSTDSVGKTIFLQMTQGCMSTVFSVILNLIRTALNLSYPVLVLMIAVVYPLVYWFALRHWAKPLRFMADSIHAQLPVLVALPILATAVVSFLPIYPAQSFASHPVYITAMMLGVEGIYFFFIYTFYRNLLKISRLLKDEARAQLLESEIISYQESLETAKQTRHDLRHHNALILDYLETGNTQAAIEYLRQADEAVTSSRLTEFSANPTANAVLRIYSRKAQELDIEYAALADIPETLPLTAPELGALLSNMLENAVEACEKAAPPHYIALTIQTDEAGLRLEIRNSASCATAFEDGMPVSTKPGGGTGTKSIAHIVKAHGGMLRFKQEGDEFLTQILLPMNK